jgi:hypothetical protein|tara:strand:- start:595 stop:732 length:138 start_codon:yes stop_codon:yes gene_type:complete
MFYFENIQYVPKEILKLIDRKEELEKEIAYIDYQLREIKDGADFK